MLRKEDWAVIKALKKRGVYHKDIAVELGVHPKTVSRPRCYTCLIPGGRRKQRTVLERRRRGRPI